MLGMHRIARLAALMLFGAWVGYKFGGADARPDPREPQAFAALLLASFGLLIELLLRFSQRPRDQRWRFTLWDILILMAALAVIFGAFVVILME